MTGGWKATPELNKYWFTMGEIAFHEGFSIEDACPYSSETMPFVQFCAGWNHAKLHTAEQASSPTPLAPDAPSVTLREAMLLHKNARKPGGYA